MKETEKHGDYGKSLFTTYNSMKQRCSNKNSPHYKNYGGRGISICDRWLESFENFYEDVGDIASDLEIDRINSNGNYEPSNVQLASRAEQMQNTRRSKRWTLYGVTYKSATIAAKELNMSKSQIGRLCNGYTHANGNYHPPKDGCSSELVYQGGV